MLEALEAGTDGVVLHTQEPAQASLSCHVSYTNNALCAFGQPQHLCGLCKMYLSLPVSCSPVTENQDILSPCLTTDVEARCVSAGEGIGNMGTAAAKQQN